MVSAYRAKFDFIVLKPAWALLICVAGASFYHGAWAIGAVCVVMMFAVGHVGAKLHRPTSFQELAAGNPGFADAERPLDIASISLADSRAVTSACFGTALVGAIVATTIALHWHGWPYSILLGIALWWLGGIFIGMLFALVARQYILGRLRSITAGMMLFWTGASIPLSAVAFALRVVL